MCTHTTRRNIFVYVDNLICADVFFGSFFWGGEDDSSGSAGYNAVEMFVYLFCAFGSLAATLSHLAWPGKIDQSNGSNGSMRSSDRAKAVSCLSAFINKL